MDSDEIVVASSSIASPPMAPLDEDLETSSAVISTATKFPPPIELAAPPIKKPRQPMEYPIFTQPTSRLEDIHDDLADFGFSTQQIKAMVGKNELPWDPAMPGYLQDQAKAMQDTRERRDRAKKNGTNGLVEKGYEPLFLTEGSSWALFDPHQGFPVHLGDPPAFFTQYTTFKPGNARILEYNIHSHNVRLKSTPHVLLAPGKGVEYATSGPRIVELAPPKRGRGRPRKYPLPVVNVADGIGKISKGKKRPRKSAVVFSESEEGSGSEPPDLEVDDADEYLEVGVKREESDDIESEEIG